MKKRKRATKKESRFEYDSCGGLSLLQRRLLGLLVYHDKSYDKKRSPIFVPLQLWQVVALLYDFPWKEGPEGTQRFNRSEIGMGRYHSARSALSRAMSRLVARGLIELRRTAYRLGDGRDEVVLSEVDLVSDRLRDDIKPEEFDPDFMMTKRLKEIEEHQLRLAQAFASALDARERGSKR